MRRVKSKSVFDLGVKAASTPAPTATASHQQSFMGKLTKPYLPEPARRSMGPICRLIKPKTPPPFDLARRSSGSVRRHRLRREVISPCLRRPAQLHASPPLVFFEPGQPPCRRGR